MAKAFTAKFIEGVKPTATRREIPDPAFKGLYLVVQPSGRKSWATRYQLAGRHRKLTLGKYPAISLADARKAAGHAVTSIEAGIDPADAKLARKAAPDRDTVKVLVEQYAAQHLSTLKRGHDAKRALEIYVVTQWGHRRVQSLARRDVRGLLDRIAAEGKKTTANRVRAYFNAFCVWLIERDVIEHNPVTGTKPFKEQSRDRILTDDELRWLLIACGQIAEPWGNLTRALILTGQRLREVAEMTVDEVTGDLWTLPASRTKNGQAHEVPLSGAAMEAIMRADRVPSRNGLLFTTTGQTPVSGFSKGHARIVRQMQAVADADRAEAVTIPRWTFHDLRRTTATGLARLGTPVRITEAVINHTSGTSAGVVGIYQRYDFGPEKRGALEAWSRHCNQLVNGVDDNVVQISAAQ
ncbi:tyrosine-type recombinase/integrase [Roseobacter ponti]|uniref:Integrase arm-type DNA-binding domain-containing protein n=1 Tax=Roseobacter ponti TaxID=1891787 RepID=A0A858SPJ2_9RHOB|nr:integrase arm-type DNA-binding domain-containing protein [Roseobacter ponti]QJF50694.1 integrase arm-type DNA-binding domain-containing protein [Roseobacter ponti]